METGAIVAIVIGIFAIQLIGAFVCVSIMGNKGYAGYTTATFFLVLFLGPVGYVYVIAMPDLNQRQYVFDMREKLGVVNKQLEACNHQLEVCKKALAQLQQTPPNT